MVPVSPEFLEICEAQVELLSDGLGASQCVVYLTNRFLESEAGNLVPVMVRPESLMPWAQSGLLAWLEQEVSESEDMSSLPGARSSEDWAIAQSGDSPSVKRSEVERKVDESFEGIDETTEIHPGSQEIEDENPPARIFSGNRSDLIATQRSLQSSMDINSVSNRPSIEPNPNFLYDSAHAIAPVSAEPSLPEQHQIALPLLYKGIMVGLLVTARPDRVWTEREHLQIEQIARTISVACGVDQRSRWLEHQLQTSTQKQLPQQQIYDHQHDVFDDLIHQFRNPLTALRTFGKLLMRRLQTTDRNFGVAESIVRESDRLQELLQQFKTALDLELPELATWEEPRTPPLLRGQSEDSAEQSGETFPPGHLACDIQHSSEYSESETSSNQFDQLSQSEQPTIDVSSSATYLTGHEICTSPCALFEVLAPVLNVAWAIAQDHNVILQVDLAPNLPLVSADQRGLQEVFSNLIDNAIKYTPSGGQVLVRAHCSSGDEQALIIADTGLGIPDIDQEHLFQRHFRGVQVDGNIPGTGLGLAIARDLLTKMDGRIEAISPVSQCSWVADWVPPDSLHPGTAFVVWLKTIL